MRNAGSEGTTVPLDQQDGDVLFGRDESCNIRIQKPAVSTPVLLVNAKNEMARTANTDAQGNYRLTEIPPGDYRVFATVQDTSDPDALERLSANAEKVTLARSARETKALEVR